MRVLRPASAREERGLSGMPEKDGCAGTNREVPEALQGTGGRCSRSQPSSQPAAELIPPQITRLIVDDVLAPRVRRPPLTKGSNFWFNWCLRWLAYSVDYVVCGMAAWVDGDLAERESDGGYPKPALPAPGTAVASVLRQASGRRAHVTRDEGHGTITAFSGRRIAVSHHQQPDVSRHPGGVAGDELASDPPSF